MRIGIIGAMNPEIEKFIDIFNLRIKNDIYEGIYSNKKIYVVESGIGKVNAAATTQKLIDKYNVDIIINSGCAGALVESVKVMDVVVASYLTYHDFKPVRVMKYSVPDNGCVISDKHLIDVAIAVLKDNNINYHIGPMASGDSFITNNELRDQVKEETNAIAVDMESTSIGHIARKNHVPFLIIRTISDFADGEDDFEVQAAHKNSMIVKDIIDKL